MECVGLFASLRRMEKYLSIVSSPSFVYLLDWSIRLLLAFVFVSYGSGKLLGGQFGGLTQEELETPIQSLSLFQVGWYLFDHQPFKAMVGLFQIIASVLLLIPRTKYIGILFLLPIIGSILIIDLTIMPVVFQWGFGFRLSGYILYLLLILLQNKSLFHGILHPPTAPPPIQNKWQYLWILLLIPAIEIIPSALKWMVQAIYYGMN